MRTLTSCAFIAASALAVGCGSNDAKPDALIVIADAAPDVLVVDAPPDAQVFDFSCMNNPAPTTAADPVVASGSVNDIDVQAMALVPVADAAVKGFKNGVAAPIKTGVSDAAGTWTLSLATGGTPLDGFVEASKATHRTVRIYPTQPLTADLAGAPVFLFANTTFQLLVGIGGFTQGAGNGTVGMAVLDCANTPVPGAVISIKQGGTELVTTTNTFDAGQFQAGVFLVFDIPPNGNGEVTTVSASYMGMNFRAHDIQVRPATTSTTAVKPGFDP